MGRVNRDRQNKSLSFLNTVSWHINRISNEGEQSEGVFSTETKALFIYSHLYITYSHLKKISSFLIRADSNLFNRKITKDTTRTNLENSQTMTEKSFESILRFFNFKEITFFSVLRRYLFTLKAHLKVLFKLKKAAKTMASVRGQVLRWCTFSRVVFAFRNIFFTICLKTGILKV